MLKSCLLYTSKYEVAQQGGKIAVIALGSFYGMGEQAAKLIEEKTGTAPTLINPCLLYTSRCV